MVGAVSLDVERLRSILDGIRVEAEASRFSSAKTARAALERIRALSCVGLSLVADHEQVEMLRTGRGGP